MKEVELAYAAGIVDGEGCIRITHPGTLPTVYSISAEIVNTSKDMLDWFQCRWGGAIQKRKLRPRHKPTMTWVLQSNQAMQFLTDIAPYLVVKKEQAMWVRALQALNSKDEKWRATSWVNPQGRCDQKMPPDLLAVKEAIYQKMKVLNKRGV